jgi:phosphomannomutase
MSLIKSISGIRGTIGGIGGEGLNPLDILKFTAAYATLIRKNTDKTKIIVGRDARISGEMVSDIVIGTLTGMGFDVINIGLATTPTTELAVTMTNAAGGIIITASHNPEHWNALKFLNDKGEFLNASEGESILKISADESFVFSDVYRLGNETKDDSFSKKHIDSVLALKLVDVEAITNAGFSVVIDCVNSVGGIIIPELLKALGVKQINKLNCEPNGHFTHNPEPLPEHLTEISSVLKQSKADVGFVVDPDVDRLAIVCENGEMFGEEYTLVSVSDYVLSKTPGSTVSNLSSTRALRDVTVKYKQKYEASSVGEVNVVEKMKATNAIIGGEGNGGVIYPACHYGRDALVGIALFLTLLAKSGKKTSDLRATYPTYFMAKQKIELNPKTDVNGILNTIANKFRDLDISTIDGVKIEWPEKWVHLRKSNTEPIIRIYAEASSSKSANELVKQFMDIIKGLI